MYYIISSSVNLNKPSDITHEVVNISCDRENAVENFGQYMQDNYPKRCRLFQKSDKTKISFNEDGRTITIQIHQQEPTCTQGYAENEFIDDFNDNDFVDTGTSAAGRKADIHSDDKLSGLTDTDTVGEMTPDDIDSRLNKIGSMVRESNDTTSRITSDYEEVVKKYGPMLKVKDRSLVLEF